jgi:hypothetical protein
MIFDFLDATAKLDQSPKQVSQLISLIGDLATQFNGNAGVKTRATVPYIENSIMMLLQQPDHDSKEKANYTLAAIKQMNVQTL